MIIINLYKNDTRCLWERVKNMNKQEFKSYRGRRGVRISAKNLSLPISSRMVSETAGQIRLIVHINCKNLFPSPAKSYGQIMSGYSFCNPAFLSAADNNLC